MAGENQDTTSAPSPRDFTVVDLNYVSVYVQEHEAAIAFYTRVFGPPDEVDPELSIHGWRMGATWLTLFPSRGGTHPDSNPRNAEFAVQVATPEEVDVLYQALIDAGAQSCHTPKDTRMYDPMRYACVDDPFGMRIDVYCPF